MNVSPSDANVALDQHNVGKKLIVFGNNLDIFNANRSFVELATVYGVELFLVYPTVENAVALQCIQHPSYLYYVDGKERFVAVGYKAFTEKFHEITAG